MSVRALAATGRNSLALLGDGSVWSFGDTSNGARGIGATGGATPLLTQVVLPATAKAVSVGLDRGYAIATDGRLFGWGENDFFIGLGDGGNTDRLSPVEIPVSGPVQAVASGWDHGLALLNDSTVLAWGRNASGALGTGDQVDRLTPVAVPGLTGIVAVAAGNSRSFALSANGTVYQWGTLETASSGLNLSRLNTPRMMAGLTQIVAIASSATAAHLLALRMDGTLMAWGANHRGQLGDGTGNKSFATAVNVATLTSVIGIAVGGRHSAAIRADGSVWTWGGNFGDELGRQDSPTTVPLPVPGVNVA